MADVHLPAATLVMPLFVTTADEPRPVASMPGVSQWPARHAFEQIHALRERGLRQFLLFGVTPESEKDARGSYAAADEAPVNQLLRRVRREALDVVMWADLCLCEYTDHGHCGVVQADGAAGDTVNVDNDATLPEYGRLAVAQAEAGADIVAPSGMMDGQVGAIRAALDKAGFTATPICSYAIKYASSFYGPFREAGEGAMKFGDRRGYQMDCRRSREWLSEMQADIDQGADMIMVKPAANYLDIIAHARRATSLPIAAYHVSGEYSMLHAAAERGWLDLPSAAIEVTTAIRRSGADLVVTYFAPKLIEWLDGR